VISVDYRQIWLVEDPFNAIDERWHRLQSST
jgi:hypothetical protein